jgi:hypothetical protein
MPSSLFPDETPDETPAEVVCSRCFEPFPLRPEDEDDHRLELCPVCWSNVFGAVIWWE